MLEAIKEIVFTNLYWFSLPAIGYGIILFIKNSSRLPKSLKQSASFVARQHILITFFLCFSITTCLVTVVSLIFYVFRLPVNLLVGIYLILLFMFGGYLVILLVRNLFSKKSYSWFGLSGQTLLTKLLFVLLASVLVLDFVASLYNKANIGGDTFYHLARIVTIIAEGFTIESGHYGNLPDGAYHFNVVYALYAIPCKLFNVMPLEVWKDSLGFFRLLQWAAIFMLVWYVVKYWLKQKEVLLMAVVATILAIALYADTLFIANYPNTMLNIWLIAFVICLSFYEQGNSKAVIPLFMSAFLMTMTHPLALMAAGFMAFYLLCKMIFARKYLSTFKEKIPVYGGVIAILMFSSVVSALLPHRLTEAQTQLGGLPMIHFLGMSLKDPLNEISLWSPAETGIVALSVFAFIFLLYSVWKNILYRIIIFALMTFYLIIMYFPPVFTVLNSLFPTWILERFTMMNVLAFITVPIGLFGLAVFMVKYVKPGRILTLTKLNGSQAVILLFVAGSLLIAPFFAHNGYKRLLREHEAKQKAYDELRSYVELDSVLKDDVLIAARPYTNFYLAAILHIDTLAVPEAHSTSTADTANRIKCQERILATASYDDLRASRVNYLVIDRYGAEKQRIVADSKPYLREVMIGKYYLVYKFEGSQNSESGTVYKPCVDYQKTEGS